MSAYTRFKVTRSSLSLWRVTFDNPPINLIDAVMMKELLNLLTEIERDKRVAVVLFDSADPDFFLAHYDIAGDPAELVGVETTAGRHPFTDLHIWLSKSPAVTISAIRGRARGAGSEFALATDIRFASRAIPDEQFVDFVDAFAQRVSRFDLLALADIKRFVNAATLPADAPLGAEIDAFWKASERPAFRELHSQA